MIAGSVDHVDTEDKSKKNDRGQEVTHINLV